MAIAQGPMAAEAPVELEYNGSYLATFLCTPQELQELALGWLYTEGLIRGLAEVMMVGACDTLQKIAVRTSEDRPRPGRDQGWRQVITSGCGGGFIREDQLRNRPSLIGSDLRLSLSEIREMTRQMMSHSSLYQQTGGIHGAALGRDGKIVAQSEDIGRHNAVDKVIGKALLKGVPPGSCVLLATGRLSSEMVIKAAQAAIPVVATLSIPTSLAVEVAHTAGMALVGRALRPRSFVYGNTTRIEVDAQAPENLVAGRKTKAI